MTILLLEPDIQLAAIYMEYLQQAGYAVQVAGSGQQAVELADACMPDIVILELALPGHNGIEFLHEFRSHRDWQAIPIIVHTLLPIKKLVQQVTALNEFDIRILLNKSATTLSQLKNSIQEITNI